MATKKKAAAAPVDVPAVLLVDDGNKTVARTKASLAKKWTLTKADALEGAVQLAWFFVALGRADEARELADHVADGVVAGADAATWSAASNALALAARLAREGGDEARRSSLVARLAERLAVAALPVEALARSVAEATKDIRSAEVDPSQKWALQGFARGCARAAYFREASAGGAYASAALDVEALERTIAEGLAGLRAHLAR